MACGCTVGACSFGLQMNSLVFSVWGLCCLSMCVHACMGVLHVYITDEGSRRIPTCVEIVNLLANVNKPQSCTYVGWYANSLHSYRLFCACVCLCFCVFVC